MEEATGGGVAGQCGQQVPFLQAGDRGRPWARSGSATVRDRRRGGRRSGACAPGCRCSGSTVWVRRVTRSERPSEASRSWTRASWLLMTGQMVGHAVKKASTRRTLPSTSRWLHSRPSWSVKANFGTVWTRVSTAPSSPRTTSRGPEVRQGRPFREPCDGLCGLQLAFLEQGDVFHRISNFVFARREVFLAHVAPVVDEEQGADVEGVCRVPWDAEVFGDHRVDGLLIPGEEAPLVGVAVVAFVAFDIVLETVPACRVRCPASGRAGRHRVRRGSANWPTAAAGSWSRGGAW